MDNNGNFEQQFMQNLRNSAAPAAPAAPAAAAPAVDTSGGSSKVSLIIAIILAMVVLVESIALVVALISLGQVNSGEYYDDDEGASDVDDVDSESNYVFNDDYDLVALNVVCDNQESGNKIELTTSNGYKLVDASGNAINTGTYTMLRDSIVVVKTSNGSESTLYYDGLVLVDGKTIYECGDTAYADE